MPQTFVRLFELLRRVVRSVAPTRFYLALAESVDSVFAIRHMGLGEYMRVRRLLSRANTVPGATVEMQIRGIAHPINVRPGTTDASEVIHTCARKVYGQFLPSGTVNLIVDAGANIGDTAVWYLNRFPEATVIAVEADEANFALLKENCRPYGQRAIPIRAAVWPRDGEILSVIPSSMASGISVAAGGAGRASGCPSISMNALLNLTPIHRLDIFKCDIEGAELELFSEGAERWLPAVRSIAIEIHTPECQRAVFSAIEPFGFSTMRYRGIYVCQAEPQ